jgi:hypothetical protein
MTVVPEHLNAAGREVAAMARALAPQVIELCERHELLRWALNELPAVDEPGGEQVAESDALHGYNVAGAAVSVAHMAAEDASDGLTNPEHVERLLGYSVPSYARQVRDNFERWDSFRRMVLDAASDDDA